MNRRGLALALVLITPIVARAALLAVSPPSPPDLAEGLPLTESEKQGLELSGGWLRHSHFGFVLPLDSGFEPDPAIQDQLNQRLVDLPEAFIWALRHRAGHQILLVLVAKGAGDDDEPAFRALARSIRSGVGDQAGDVIEDHVEWGGRAKEFRYAAQLVDGGYVQVRCLPSDAVRTEPYIVCVQTLTADSSSLDAARDSLQVRR
jgi:hypothetical protein